MVHERGLRVVAMTGYIKGTREKEVAHAENRDQR